MILISSFIAYRDKKVSTSYILNFKYDIYFP